MTRLALKSFAILLFVTMLFRSVGFVLALESEALGVAPQRVYPGSFFYFFKRAYEKVRVVFVFSTEGKISYNETLLDKRLSELDYVTKNKIISQLEKASNRFSFFAGVLVEEIEKAGVLEDEGRVLEKFAKYTDFLASVRDRFPANSAEWLFIQQNIDTLVILSERLTG